MRILVTGAAGFIGSHLVKALEELGHEVVALDIKYGHDISKSGPLLGNYDAIYHLASCWLSFARDNPDRAIDINVKGTVNVLECARRCKAKVIYSSASSVYGKRVTGRTDESAPLQPVSIYGATKVAAETLILTYNRLYDIPFFIFRFTNVYGPNQEGGLYQVFSERLLKNEPVVIYGSGEQTRDFVYVGDVVHFLLRALEQDKKNEIVNLGSGKETSINEFVRICASILGIVPTIKHEAEDIDERQGFCADITKLERIFGERPKTSLEEGLKKTCLEEKRSG